MNKNDILFVGIGQAGNNLISEILKKNNRYNGLFINTSIEDVKGLDNAVNTFIIPSASGSAKNRNKAKEYSKKHIQAIIDKIDEFPNQDVINFAFSLGGGTGSGISPMLIQVLSKVKPNKRINIIAIKPKEDESKRTLENSLSCWNELVSIKAINTFYILDNGKRNDKLIINKEFADLYDSFLNTTQINKNGVIDGSELEVLTNSRGFGAIYNIDSIKGNSDVWKVIDNSIFLTGNNTTCNYLGISVNEGFNYSKVTDIFTIKEDMFLGYTNLKPTLILGGIPLNNNVIKDIKNSLDILKITIDNSSQTEDELLIELDSSNTIQEEKKVEEAKSIDELMENEDDFWNSIMNM